MKAELTYTEWNCVLAILDALEMGRHEEAEQLASKLRYNLQRNS